MAQLLARRGKMSSLLEVKDLQITLKAEKNSYNLVEGINLKIGKKKSFGLVGESGCGKSITVLSFMGLLPSPPLQVTKGHVIFNDEVDLLKLPRDEFRKYNGKEISMIFQEPMTALDPLFTIGEQITEVLKIHEKMGKKEMFDKSVVMLEKVGISRPEGIMKEYPHQLSGGMRQRIMIAMAMICNSKLLIADEPTTALDVTIQAQILDLMNELKEGYDTSLLMITHDLGVIAETCERVAVLYAGEIVEEADINDIFHDTMHPYTNGLLKSVTTLGDRSKILYSIPGMVPSYDRMPVGCRFAQRCPKVMNICEKEHPHLINYRSGHSCRCWLYRKEGAIIE
jgi:oligopeptide/dipeptide ABC transporter ATP-binding protein